MPAVSPEDALKLVAPVIRDVVGQSVEATFDVDPEYRWAWRAQLRSRTDPLRRVVLRGSLEWFDLRVVDLGVGTRIFDVDWDEADLRGVVTALSEVAREYLTGRGRVEWRKRWFRTHTVLRVNTPLGEWVMGHRMSITPNTW